MSLFIDEVIEENARLKERIEELEEELRVAREHSNNMDWYNDNQYKLLNKYKKAIEILKRELNFYFADETQKIIIDDSNSWDMLNISLNKEDYNLLKEVFNNE